MLIQRCGDEVFTVRAKTQVKTANGIKQMMTVMPSLPLIDHIPALNFPTAEIILC